MATAGSFLSSGTTAIATTDDNPVTLIANSGNLTVRRIVIYNAGTVTGFFSVDGGTNWSYLPATAAGTNAIPIVIELQSPCPCVVKVKRIASGSNLASVYGYMA